MHGGGWWAYLSHDEKSDKPEVSPLEYDSPAGDHVNDLHRLSAEILSRLTGNEHPSEEDIHNFIHEAYHAAFHQS